MNINLCNRFWGLEPFKVRSQRFHDVLLIFRRLNHKSQVEEKKNGVKLKDGTIRRPARNDDWY